MVAHFKPVVNANCRLVAPPPTRWTAIGGYPKVASYDMLGEQLHYSDPVRVYRRKADAVSSTPPWPNYGPMGHVWPDEVFLVVRKRILRVRLEII